MLEETLTYGNNRNYVYFVKLPFQKFSSSQQPYSVKLWGYTGSLKGLAVESAATDGICQSFLMNFQRQLPYYN
jgi:hypothetical protein